MHLWFWCPLLCLSVALSALLRHLRSVLLIQFRVVCQNVFCQMVQIIYSCDIYCHLILVDFYYLIWLDFYWSCIDTVSITLRELIYARTYFANEFFRHFAGKNFREWGHFKYFARIYFREWSNFLFFFSIFFFR